MLRNVVLNHVRVVLRLVAGQLRRRPSRTWGSDTGWLERPCPEPPKPAVAACAQHRAVVDRELGELIQRHPHSRVRHAGWNRLEIVQLVFLFLVEAGRGLRHRIPRSCRRGRRRERLGRGRDRRQMLQTPYARRANGRPGRCVRAGLRQAPGPSQRRQQRPTAPPAQQPCANKSLHISTHASVAPSPRSPSRYRQAPCEHSDHPPLELRIDTIGRTGPQNCRRSLQICQNTQHRPLETMSSECR